MKTFLLEIPTTRATFYPMASLGIGFRWAWVFCLMFAMRKILDASTSYDASSETGFTLAIFIGTCAVLLVRGIFDRNEESSLHKTFATIATAVAACATAVLLLSLTAASDEMGCLILVWVSGLCAGAATGYLLMSWGYIYRTYDRFSVAMNVGFGLVLAVALYGFVSLLTSIAAFFLLLISFCTLSGILCVASLSTLEEVRSSRGSTDQGTDSKSHDVYRYPLVVYRNPYFLKLALILLIFGFVESILRELALSSIRLINDISTMFSSLLLAVSGFLLLFVFLYLILDNRIQEKRSSSLITIIVVGIAVAILFFMGGNGDIAYLAVSVIAYLIFEVYLWTYLTQVAKDYRFPSHIVYGLGLFLLFLGQLASPITNGFASALVSPLQLDTLTEPVILMLLLLIVVVLLSTGNMSDALGIHEDIPVTVTITEDEALSRRIQVTEHRYLLTEREGEILRLLIRGRTLPKISETLVVSENTIKTHVKRIYRKTGVHSRQELMDLVDEA